MFPIAKCLIERYSLNLCAWRHRRFVSSTIYGRAGSTVRIDGNDVVNLATWVDTYARC